DAHATNWPIPDETLRRKLAVPSQGRLYYVRYALKMGWTVEQIHGLTHIDPWFLAQMKELTDFESELQSKGDFASLDSQYVRGTLQKAKALGYSDVQLSSIWNVDPKRLRQYRKQLGASCVYKLVDTCAAEFEAATPYYYSTYEMPFSVVGATLASPATSPASESGRARQASPLQDAGTTMVAEDEIRLTDKPKVIIIGGGPNRIGQGIEFDYCCVQAAFAMRELGLESVMINSNPETVSTDYDTSDLLFFEPLTHEDVLNVCERLNGKPFGAPRDAQAHGSAVGIEGARPTGLVKGVIVQFGGQTPLNLARGLHDAGVPIIGTSIDMLEAAGDREKFRTLVEQVGLKQPANGIARSVDDARKIAAEIGYPVLVRPSFVLGGRAMEIVSDEAQLNHYMAIAVKAEGSNPILVDKFLDHATECDVDCIADYDPLGNGRSVICGVMEHIEEAGIHSGDSACALPPYSFTPEIIRQLKDHTHKLASVLKVRGLMNVQYAIKDGEIYLIEVNPRASRTIPFVGKATGVPWALLAAKVMAGESLDKLGVHEIADPKHVSVKEVVFPFSKFPGVDVILGPEMRSTGEVMGIDDDFAGAYAKAQMAAGAALPLAGTVFISVNDRDKPEIADVARLYADAGFKILATGGTYDVLAAAGVKSERISKLAEGRPNVRDAIKNGQLQLIINTPTKKGPATDEGKIRAMSVMNKVPIVTTVTAARAAGKAIGKLQKNGWSVKPLQAYHAAKSD
ncbi:MAG TPA: carbamoyl-phosphate synthase large subunit, partial [Tepidisphaeraceae bacterium]